MRKLILPSFVAIGTLVVGVVTPAQAGDNLPPGCSTPTQVTFGGDETQLADGDYTSPDPAPIVELNVNNGTPSVAYAVTTPGWRILHVSAQYEYRDEGGVLGQAEDRNYPDGVTSDTIGFAFSLEFESWGPYVFFNLAFCGTPPSSDPTTSAAPTTAAPTTAAPTTAAPTTATPTTSIAAAPATPTTVAGNLPSTGRNLTTSLLAGITLLLGGALILATRRTSSKA